MSEPQRIRYRLTAGDYAVAEKLTRYRLDRGFRADAWTPKMQLMSLPIALFVFLPLAVIVAATENAIRWTAIYFVLVPWLLPKLFAMILRKRWLGRRASQAQDVEAQLTDQELLIDSGHLSSRIRMAGIRSGRVLEKHLHLQLENGNDLVIPLRAFSDAEMQRRWCEQLTSGARPAE